MASEASSSRVTAAAAKVAAYEELLNEKLKAELQGVHDRRDAVYERISEW